MNALRTTSALRAGDRVVIPETDARGFYRPVTPQHPGTAVRVESVAPALRNGKPFMRGRGKAARPLFDIRFAGVDSTYMATAEHPWTLA